MSREFWDERYAAGSVWSDTPNAWVAATVASLDPGVAVDLGAGEGRNAIWLAERGWEVTAVDFSPVGLATGASKATEKGLDIEWVTAHATAWVSPQLVDLVVVAYLQLPADPLALAIGNAASYLAPGGTLALVSHDRENTVGGPQDPEILTTVEQLRAAASGLEILECAQAPRETAAGTALDTVLVARR